MLPQIKPCPAEVPELYLSLGLRFDILKSGSYQSNLHLMHWHASVLNGDGCSVALSSVTFATLRN